jgi:hypothetical protein
MERESQIPANHGAAIESDAEATTGTRGTRPWRLLGAVIAGSILPGLLLLYVVLLNLRTVTNNDYVVLPHLTWLGDSLGLNQKWSMFAPRPPHNSGWFVVPGTERDGRRLDFWRGPKPLSWREPRSILELYPNERWRKYVESLAWSSENDIEYSRYLCRSWNASHTGPHALVHFKMYFMRIDTPPPLHPLRQVKPKRIQLVTWYCFGKPK